MNWTPIETQAQTIEAQRATLTPTWGTTWLTAQDAKAWR